MNQLSLKATLLVEGINYAPEAFNEVGTTYKEQNHGLFGWDFVNHKGVSMPDDFLLPDGTVVQFRYNPSSPYSIVDHGGAHAIETKGEMLSRISLIPRPSYYERSTIAGTEMRRVAQVGGLDCFFVCYQNYCSHFSKGNQCLFCNLVSTNKTYGSVVSRKAIEDIGECAAAAFAEGTCRHILLTGGCFAHEAEVDMVCDIIKEIRSALGVDTVPGTVLPSATTDIDDLRRYHDAGIAAIGYSMEIWDPALYSAICPGKAGTLSHEGYFTAIKKAVKVFGPGNVYAVFVMGLEPGDTLLEGIKCCYEAGANVVPFVWSPNPGSRLQGHRAPFAQWYIDTIQAAAEIAANSGVPLGVENHCYQCDGNSLLHDALRAPSI